SRSVLMDDVFVGRHAQIDRASIDKNVIVEEGARVGLDSEHDRARGFTISESGLTVVPKGVVIRADRPR
ncbi:MAG TPA: glucose-1-phosphate adenylyltransferase, partial [Actinomycetales bacterium]|nr:glucose-1-phosphate adenylyltransferase [Actinomycetales bacterium]